jgi:hypothetical protein
MTIGVPTFVPHLYSYLSHTKHCLFFSSHLFGFVWKGMASSGRMMPKLKLQL